MKNKVHKILLLPLLLFLTFSLISCNNNGNSKKTSNNQVTKIRLNEVARSIFYAPMYAAISEGFFKAEGIEIELTTGQGADKTMQQLLSGSVDIGFSGPEQVIYIYNQNRQDYPVVFAQLTQRDGSFLVGRNKEADFTWESLKGKTVVGGRPGGVPEMALEYVLKNHGLNPEKDLNLITNIAFNATAGAFKGGTGDYVALFEPTGSMLEKENAGSIVASIGKSAGVIPYTCFYTTKSYMEKNSEILERFTRAIYKGQLWVQKSKDEVVAKSIISFFPGTDEAMVINVLKNYRDIDAFASSPSIKEEDMSRLMDIIQSYKSDLIPKRPPFKDIVNNNFSNKAVSDLK
ncbi:ABC transporter substrate-binding protein [Clostridium polynesiense]|uniref:ABC transporter substrate-binding protein n=1 Tax=Clostridium polynesiense TaxID=1325933 RepID=UPI00058D5871|nr:ABC transporter substrate-binding protein [Clostridium polynesiense]